MIYYLIAIAIFVVYLCRVKKETVLLDKTSLIYFNKYNIFYLLFIILGSIRWETGTDWNSYLNFFINNTTLDSYKEKGFEFGFSLFNYFIHKLSSSYTIYLFIYTSIIVIIDKYNIKKLAVYYGLSLYLYYCTYLGGILAVRQLLAQSICYLSITAITEKKFKKFLFITAIAVLIHRTAIVWLFAYYLYNKKIRTNTFIILYIICLCIGLFGNQLFPKIVGFVYQTLLKIHRETPILSRLYGYTFIRKEEPNYLMIFISIFKRFLFVPFFLIYRKSISAKSRFSKGILNLYLCGNAIYLLFSTSFVVFQRACAYFCTMEVYLLPCLICIFKKKSTKIIFILLFFLYGLLKIYTQILPYPEEVKIYKTIFSVR